MTVTDECRERYTRLVEALRSGKYKKAKGTWCVWKDGRWEMCVLGVYDDVNHPGWWEANATNSSDDEVHYFHRPDDLTKFHDNCRAEIAGPVVRKNDFQNESFEQIADWIERTYLT